LVREIIWRHTMHGQDDDSFQLGLLPSQDWQASAGVAAPFFFLTERNIITEV
jgi:hypothetical protein